MKIGIGIARGLRYMHNEVEPPFSLSELHSSAVYLTEDFTPNVSICESIITTSTNNQPLSLHSSNVHACLFM